MVVGRRAKERNSEHDASVTGAGEHMLAKTRPGHVAGTNYPNGSEARGRRRRRKRMLTHGSLPVATDG